jgi:hypothetical protein
MKIIAVQKSDSGLSRPLVDEYLVSAAVFLGMIEGGVRPANHILDILFDTP